MRFKIGKCYEHTTGKQIKIVGVAQTTLSGMALVAESSDSIELRSVGGESDDYAVNYKEISEEKWMKNFK